LAFCMCLILNGSHRGHHALFIASLAGIAQAAAAHEQ